MIYLTHPFLLASNIWIKLSDKRKIRVGGVNEQKEKNKAAGNTKEK